VELVGLFTISKLQMGFYYVEKLITYDVGDLDFFCTFSK
jgi:hypothetical protein